MYLDTQRTIIVLTNRGPIRGHSRPTPPGRIRSRKSSSTVEQRIAHQDFAVPPPPTARADEVLFTHWFKHSGLETVLADVGHGPKRGHEDQFPRPTLSARCRFSQGTFARTRGNGRDAPTADLHDCQGPPLPTRRSHPHQPWATRGDASKRRSITRELVLSPHCSRQPFG